jgi:hypothetical protein
VRRSRRSRRNGHFGAAGRLRLHELRLQLLPQQRARSPVVGSSAELVGVDRP